MNLSDYEREANEGLARNILNGGACDFCSRPFAGGEVVWRTPSRVMMQITVVNLDGSEETATRDYGTGWAACVECDAILKLGDPQALFDHVAPLVRTGEQEVDDANAETLMKVFMTLIQEGIKPVDALADSHPRVTTREEAEARMRICVESAKGLNAARVVTADEIGDEADYLLVRRILAFFLEAERLDKQWNLNVFDVEDHLTMRMLSKHTQKVTDAMAAHHRAERIAGRQATREEPHAMAGRTCASCGKREARVDDLCKRCAREAGVLPKGKIT